jgi:hypothetical protein
MSNPFLDYGNEIETPSDYRRHRKESRAQERAKKKALEDRDQLFKAWKHWHEERKQELLEGPYAEAARELVNFLEYMKLEDANDLIELVQRGPWNDRDVKYMVLVLIDHRIIFLREQAGLPAFDDPLPDEEPDTFMTLREMLR